MKYIKHIKIPTEIVNDQTSSQANKIFKSVILINPRK